MRGTSSVGRGARWAGAIACVVAAGLVAWPRPARAFSIATLGTAGCHEKITTDALREVRSELATAAPLPASRDERALIADLPFSLASDMSDLGGATLLAGVRDNDLAGLDGGDLSRLAILHGDPNLQYPHCLHRMNDAEPDGSPAALLDCRGFILERVAEALSGLDGAGSPDLASRTSLPLHLALRHRVDAPLPTFYVRIGQALHALEDSFAHTYRTPDGTQVTAVVNWIDEVEENLKEAMDGPPHSTEMDRCDDPDELRRSRRILATQAAASMLRITLDPTRSHEQKLADVSALLDEAFSYSPGCTAQNAWCDAPERKLEIYEVFGCDVGASSAGAEWGSVAVLALVGLGARRRRRASRRAGAVPVAIILTIVAAISGRARAEAPAVTTSVPEPGPADPSRRAFGVYLGAGGSVNDPALAATLGARLRATRHWVFGVDLEWNPWLAVGGDTRFRSGALNLYGTVMFRLPLATQRFNLRVAASVGASRTLIDLYGVPEGNIGLFLGLSPLGIELKASRLFYVVINPLGVAVPIPQMGGIPFWYPQYRASIGIELYAS